MLHRHQTPWSHRTPDSLQKSHTQLKWRLSVCGWPRAALPLRHSKLDSVGGVKALQMGTKHTAEQTCGVSERYG
ncbi:hypothetical protein BJ970_003999 [Saccharopolyspora phatthalungensis]|uniref:Uncharacterized protein n=1 Tax=Saccharopolyspora phatthalungensis TaxID=664693 RepID=A0A840QDD3_9PSEU|nr:hypothetical protein [Saccharopolyspora phatthalungensis]